MPSGIAFLLLDIQSRRRNSQAAPLLFFFTPPGSTEASDTLTALNHLEASGDAKRRRA